MSAENEQYIALRATGFKPLRHGILLLPRSESGALRTGGRGPHPGPVRSPRRPCQPPGARPCRALSRQPGLATVPDTRKTVGMKARPDPHYRHRFPAEIISHAVWLYHVFSLSLRDVELLLAERGIILSYETVRRWCRKFGQNFANCLRRPGRGQVISGLSMRYLSGSKVCSTISGTPWIRMALSSTSLFRTGAMPVQPSVSSGGS